MNQNVHNCIQTCLECLESCNHCFNQCLQEDDVKMMASAFDWTANVQIFVHWPCSRCSETARLWLKFARFAQMFVKRAETNAKSTITTTARHVHRHVLHVQKHAGRWQSDMIICTKAGEDIPLRLLFPYATNAVPTA